MDNNCCVSYLLADHGSITRESTLICPDEGTDRLCAVRRQLRKTVAIRSSCSTESLSLLRGGWRPSEWSEPIKLWQNQISSGWWRDQYCTKLAERGVTLNSRCFFIAPSPTVSSISECYTELNVTLPTRWRSDADMNTMSQHPHPFLDACSVGACGNTYLYYLCRAMKLTKTQNLETRRTKKATKGLTYSRQACNTQAKNNK